MKRARELGLIRKKTNSNPNFRGLVSRYIGDLSSGRQAIMATRFGTRLRSSDLHGLLSSATSQN